MGHADREVPSPQSVSADGVRYEEASNARMRGFAQSGGLIVATDVKTKKELWTVLVYQVQFDPAEERDVQEIFITALEVGADGKHLLVTNEDGARFSVDVRSHVATPLAFR